MSKRIPEAAQSSSLAIDERTRATIKFLASNLKMDTNYNAKFLAGGAINHIVRIIEGKDGNKMIRIQGGGQVFDVTNVLYFQLDKNHNIEDFYTKSHHYEAKRLEGSTKIPPLYTNLTMDKLEEGLPQHQIYIPEPKTIELIKKKLQTDLAIMQNKDLKSFNEEKDRELSKRFADDNVIKSSVLMKKDVRSDNLIMEFKTIEQKEAFLRSFNGTTDFLHQYNDRSPFENDKSNANVLLVRKASRNPNTSGYYPTLGQDFAITFLDQAFAHTFCNLVPNFQDNGLSSYIPQSMSKESYENYLTKEHTFPISLEKHLLKEVELESKPQFGVKKVSAYISKDQENVVVLFSSDDLRDKAKLYARLKTQNSFAPGGLCLSFNPNTKCVEFPSDECAQLFGKLLGIKDAKQGSNVISDANVLREITYSTATTPDKKLIGFVPAMWEVREVPASSAGRPFGETVNPKSQASSASQSQ